MLSPPWSTGTKAAALAGLLTMELIRLFASLPVLSRCVFSGIIFRDLTGLGLGLGEGAMQEEPCASGRGSFSQEQRGEENGAFRERPVEWCQEQRVGLEDVAPWSVETRGMAFEMNSWCFNHMW